MSRRTMDSSEYIQIDKAIRRKVSWSDNQAVSCAGGDLYNLAFTSGNAGHLLGGSRYDCPDHGPTFDGEATGDDVIDCDIQENIQSRYPLLRESTANGRADEHDYRSRPEKVIKRAY